MRLRGPACGRHHAADTMRPGCWHPPATAAGRWDSTGGPGSSPQGPPADAGDGRPPRWSGSRSAAFRRLHTLLLLQHSDFQCPACQSVQEPLKQILSKYEGKVSFVYRHFPLVSIHKNSTVSAQASEAAAIQGKFWEMHDKLFATQNIWEGMADPKATFGEYASELGLDKDKFMADIESQAAKDGVSVDSLDATRFRLSGTPTFFVNGVKTEFGQLETKIEGLVK